MQTFFDRFAPLQNERIRIRPREIPVFSEPLININYGQNATSSVSDAADMQKMFPTCFGGRVVEFSAASASSTATATATATATTRPVDTTATRPIRVAVVLSGGQAPGGHNVIAGIFDRIRQIHADSIMYGFLDGPHGVFSNRYMELTPAIIDEYRNQGGFDMIGSGRHKIETEEQFQSSMKNCANLGLDGLVIIGGDDSNTNACLLGEYFRQHGAQTCVVGAPKTIDGDLKFEDQIEVSFGFDTATKTYSELIGNVMFDAMSTAKYYHFIRLMGRSASHITLECAMQTCPNLSLIGEEVELHNQSLASIVHDLCDLIVERSNAGKNYGVILVPEGLVEFVPEMKVLIRELNEVLATLTSTVSPADPDHGAEVVQAIVRQLSGPSAQLFELLPTTIRNQLLLDRDPHGNVMVSRIETEQLLVLACRDELNRRRTAGSYHGKFKTQTHFFGYEGRSGLPTAFDSLYCYALGQTAATLVFASSDCCTTGSRHEFTGYISTVKNLRSDNVSEWRAGAAPLTMMMNMERRKGANKPVIRKSLVEMDSQIFRLFAAIRSAWRLGDHYRNPGPIQFTDDHPKTTSGMSVMGPQPNFTVLYADHYNNTANPTSVVLPFHTPAYYAHFSGTATPTPNPHHHELFLTQSAIQSRRRHAAQDLPLSLHARWAKTQSGWSTRPISSPGCSATDSDHYQSDADRARVAQVFPITGSQSPVIIDSSNSSTSSSSSTSNSTTNSTKSASAGGAQRVGIVFMGRQAPGGDNVVAGIHDALAEYADALGPDGPFELIGFPYGIESLLSGEHVRIQSHSTTDNNNNNNNASESAPGPGPAPTVDESARVYPACDSTSEPGRTICLDAFRNQGGLTLLGRGMSRLSSAAELAAARATVDRLHLTGLVLIGGSTTVQHGASLAEYIARAQSEAGVPVADRCRVIVVPASVAGELRSRVIETSIGFDTTSRVYSQLAGNIAADGKSAKKYYYCIRLMGRLHSHLSLEVALQMHPNYALIGEELAAKHRPLRAVVNDIADMIVNRWRLGKEYGVILIPEGVVSHIPDVALVIQEIDEIYRRLASTEADAAAAVSSLSRETVLPHMSQWNRVLFESLPRTIQDQLIGERESHGSVPLSEVESEKLLIACIEQELERRKKAGIYKGTFTAHPLFFGYQARSSMPSVFDSNLGYASGVLAVALIVNGHSSYAAVMKNLTRPVAEWRGLGVPLVQLMHPDEFDVPNADPAAAITEFRDIACPVDLGSRAFKLFAAQRDRWMTEDRYRNPGPIQFAGALADAPSNYTLLSEQEQYQSIADEVDHLITELESRIHLGIDERDLSLVHAHLKSLGIILDSQA